jgi:hypothetical protein
MPLLKKLKSGNGVYLLNNVILSTMRSSNCTNNRLLGNSSIRDTGARFTVVCKRCKCEFDVIRNWGGGIQVAGNERINPAECPSCGSMQLELF